MAAWVTISASDLNVYLVAAQVSAMQTAALGVGQTNPFTPAMQDRTNYVRARISKRIQISETAYAVPPELKTCACMLIIEAMQPRIKIPLTDDQKTAIERAYKDLDIAATDEFPVSTPDDPTTPDVQRSTSRVRVVSSRTRTATGGTMAGI